jgi:hypothetical protein
MKEHQAKTKSMSIINNQIKLRLIVILLTAIVLFFPLLHFDFQSEGKTDTLMISKPEADRKKLLYVFLSVGTHPERNENQTIAWKYKACTITS